MLNVLDNASSLITNPLGYVTNAAINGAAYLAEKGVNYVMDFFTKSEK